MPDSERILFQKHFPRGQHVTLRVSFFRASFIDRHGFCLWVGALCAAGAEGKPPNIIFLMSDQQRWDCIGSLNPLIKTPALDKIAATGIVFDQAVCQGPMCVPSRYSMMLGLYPSQVGVLSNRDQLPDAQLPCTPLPELLRQAGYQTAGFGKTHWGGGGRSTRGFTVRYIGQPSDVLVERGAVMMGDRNPEGLGAIRRKPRITAVARRILLAIWAAPARSPSRIIATAGCFSSVSTI